jgi:hypothetical protein
MSFHAFTRCDTTSAFKGIGKVKPIKTLQKSPQFQSALAQIGDSGQISEDLFLQMEAFNCFRCSLRQFLHGGNTPDLDQYFFRHQTFHPLNSTFLWSYYSANHSHRKSVYPEPTHDNGWQCVDGMIEPKWVSGDFIPQQLADVLVEKNIAGLTFFFFFFHFHGLEICKTAIICRFLIA